MGTIDPTLIARTGPAELITSRELELCAAYLEPRWYAFYTCANREKRVARLLEGRALECFLPVHASVRRWKDRRVLIDLPLFPGYVFVRLPLRERLRVLEVPSVVQLVGFGGIPAALPEEEIQVLRRGLKTGICARPHPYLKVGRAVRVKSGPLQGMQGIVVRNKNRVRVVISFDLIMRSVAVEADITDLEPLG
jgi:transcription antitermination factor NusG